VPYAPRGRTEDGYLLDWRRFGVGEVLPKSGKYQDDRIVDAHLYYYALFRAMARVAAADKRGCFDHHLGRQGDGGPPARSAMGQPLPADTRARRAALVSRNSQMFGSLKEFVLEYAPGLFGGEIADAAYLDRLKGEYVEMAPYFTAAMHALAAHPELHVLSHVNLQIDNAWFWRSADADGAGEAVLECGLLDWYNASRVPAVSVFMGCLSGIEPEVLAAHEEGLMRCFADEYFAG